MPDRTRPPVTADPRFRRRLLNVVLVPVGLMLVVAVLLVAQIEQMRRDSGLVAHSDLVLAQAYDVQKLTIDMETGLRGFLVTGDDVFLEPYNAARAVLPVETQKLYDRTVGRPDQQARVRAIDPRREAWEAYAEDQIARRRAGGDYATVVREGRGKAMMDGMRGAFGELLQIETRLRDARQADAVWAAHATFALVALVAVVGGGLLALLARYQVLQITTTYDAAIAAAEDGKAHLERRVTERTAELNAANGQLGEMNKELEAFAYSVSHDLRAPMRHITGFANLLQTSLAPTLTKDDKENLDTIHDTAKLAGRMVDDLLGFSRIGRVQLNPAAVDVAGMVEECRKELGPDTAGRDVAWSIRPIRPVAADPALLKLVVRNLMSNAVKYTAKRSHARIDIGPSHWPRAATGGPADGVTFAVTDNGVGFDMAYAHKLFGVFQRLHRAEDFEGTGIGLANVKRIITRLGGGVWAEGVPDGGATFYVSLPAVDLRHSPALNGAVRNADAARGVDVVDAVPAV